MNARPNGSSGRAFGQMCKSVKSALKKNPPAKARGHLKPYFRKNLNKGAVDFILFP